VSPIAAVSAWVRERRTKRAKRAAWDRYVAALWAVDDAKREFESAPNVMTAERLRCAEIEHGDAIAIAGEFGAMNLSWRTQGTRQAPEIPVGENQLF
jgi:hypothetical protein